jgi:hypothetical protein
MVDRGFFPDPQTGRNNGRVDKDGNVFWYDAETRTEKKIGTQERDGKLLDLEGNFTGLYLLEGAADAAAFARFKALAAKSPAS